jgi:UDP-N-acetylmuramoyl-tripeptide--D-alanyl-D-alanine ligase
MVELGDRQEEFNREFGRQAAHVCDRVILVGERQTAPIAAGLTESGFKDVTVTATVEEALERAAALDGKDKIVLLSNDLPDNY